MASSIFKRDDVVGKLVVDAKGYYIGKASDIGFDVSGKLALIIESDEGEQKYIFFDQVQAIGDVILLKPEEAGAAKPTNVTPQANVQATVSPAPTTAAPPAGNVIYCPQCGHPNPSDGRFCENCGTPLEGEGRPNPLKKLFKR